LEEGATAQAGGADLVTAWSGVEDGGRAGEQLGTAPLIEVIMGPGAVVAMAVAFSARVETGRGTAGAFFPAAVDDTC